MEQKGSMLLKVMSIIMMVGGILSAVGSFFTALLAGVFQAGVSVANSEGALSAEENATAGGAAALLWIGVVILIVSAVVEIIAGVKGKNNWNNPAMAKTLLIFGVVCALLSLLGIIFFGIGTGTVASAIMSIITGLVVPALYIVGTIQLKNQA